MNKRQSKKQALQMQVDDLEDNLDATISAALGTSKQLNKTIDRTNKNFTEVASQSEGIYKSINKVLDLVGDVSDEVIQNRIAVVDIQRQLKIARFIDLLLVITILFLSIRS